METDSKICFGCKKDLPFTEYTKAKLGKYGLMSKCKSCRALESTIYNSIHKERISVHGKKYRQEKSKQISAQRAIHTHENKERLASYEKAWRKTNPGKMNAKTARRRAARRQGLPKWLTREQHKEILNFYIRAVELRKETGIPYEVDHIIPLQGKTVSGLHVPWNLRIIPRHENRKKSRKIII